MPNPYPRELWVRAVRAYESRTEPYPVIAARFEIGPATLMRWVQRQRETGTVDPLAKGGGWVSPVVWAVLKPLIGAKPDQTCEEFTRAYNRVAIPRIRRSTALRTGPCCRARDGGPRRAGPVADGVAEADCAGRASYSRGRRGRGASSRTVRAGTLRPGAAGDGR